MESQKRTHPDTEPQSSAKKPRIKYNRVSINLAPRLAKAMGEVVVTNLNEEHRQQCLKTLNAQNGSEATEKIEELLEKFKGNKRQKKSS
jgi:cobalamin-dependent methionine synthase I